VLEKYAITHDKESADFKDNADFISKMWNFKLTWLNNFPMKKNNLPTFLLNAKTKIFQHLEKNK